MTKKIAEVPAEEPLPTPTHISKLGIAKQDKKAPVVPAGPGHNTGDNFTVRSACDEIIRIDEEKKKLSEEQRAIKNRIKERFGKSKRAISEYLKLLKIDPADAEALMIDLKDLDNLYAGQGQQGMLALVFGGEEEALPVPKSPVPKKSA